MDEHKNGAKQQEARERRWALKIRLDFERIYDRRPTRVELKRLIEAKRRLYLQNGLIEQAPQPMREGE